MSIGRLAEHIEGAEMVDEGGNQWLADWALRVRGAFFSGRKWRQRPPTREASVARDAGSRFTCLGLAPALAFLRANPGRSSNIGLDHEDLTIVNRSRGAFE
ncbi:MAG TPA: hypothetical protein VIV60_28670 [Polyangiaceae bacterium]